MKGWIPEGFSGIHATTTQTESVFNIWGARNEPAILYADPQFPELLVLELPSIPNNLVIWNPREARVTLMPNPSRINTSEARLQPSNLRILDLTYALEQVAPDKARILQDHVSKALGYDPTQMD
jgi:hypothetical protein